MSLTSYRAAPPRVMGLLLYLAVLVFGGSWRGSALDGIRCPALAGAGVVRRTGCEGAGAQGAGCRGVRWVAVVRLVAWAGLALGRDCPWQAWRRPTLPGLET
jgi:hypothetical protein